MRKRIDNIKAVLTLIGSLMGLCLVLGIFVSFVYGIWQNGKLPKEIQQNNSGELSQSMQPAPHASFLTQKELYEVLANSKVRTAPEGQSALEKKSEIEGTVLAGVVPHHLVAGSLITDLMAALSHQNPELLVIVGPNHHNQGGKIITGFADWQTPEGLVETEEEMVRTLLEKGRAVQDEWALSQEHAVGSLMPLIRHYLPQAKVVPLVFHHDVTLEEVDKLLTVLEPLLSEENSVLLASVDFSHYLTRKEAEEKDSLTLEVMKNFDYATLFHLGNDHLDSPASLATVFRYAQTKGIREFQLLANTNSGVILQNDFIETTSYFTLLFLKSDQS